MGYFLFCGLAVACVLFWQQLRDLRLRLATVEAEAFARIASLEAALATPPAAAPAPAPEPEPEPAPRAPARIVYRRAAAEDETESAAPASAEPTEADAEPAPRRGFAFEDIFGRKLPIWVGGAALAVAGLLIVQYSIEQGLLSPAIRAVFGLLFGAGLIVGAETARRQADRIADPRIPQALAGAGVATLYGTVLAATNLYALVPPMLGFAGLALVTLLALGLALRFGAPSALLGLVGGLSAPALVGAGPPNMPLLATYLALTVGGLCGLAHERRWWWLGASALLGGFGWGLTLILGGVLDTAATLSLGLYTLAIAIALPMLITGGGLTRAVRGAGALLGFAQMAVLVGTGGFAPLTWGLYGLLSAAAIWLSRRDAQLAALPAPALGVLILLLLAWPTPTVGLFALVLGGAMLLHAGPALQRLWRTPEGRIDAGLIGALAIALPLVPAIPFATRYADGWFAGLALIGAALAGFAAATGWRRPREDWRFALLVVAAAAATGLAAAFGLPDWLLPPALAALAVALLLFARPAAEARLDMASWGFGGLAALIALAMAADGGDLARIFATDSARPDWQGALRWASVAGFGLMAALRSGRFRPAGQVLAVAFGYGAVARLAGPPLLPLLAAAALPALAWARRDRPIEPALATLLVLILGWAAAPLATWLEGGTAALAGVPFRVGDVPGRIDALTRLAVPAAAMLLALRLRPMAAAESGAQPGRAVLALAAGLGLIAAHISWKGVFGIDGEARFIDYGVAERTLWQLILAAGAFTALRRGLTGAALALGGVALAHFGWFTLLLHNPLWETQRIGPWLVPAFGAALALLWAADERVAAPRVQLALGIGQMGLILLFALTALRQLAAGPIIAWVPVGAGEDIARSVVAIALAIGFLLWGIRRARQEWRVGSLALMLAAVGKVFVLDAAGLDGLLRIASFAALGFSLIGVGWLYARFLPERRAVPD